MRQYTIFSEVVEMESGQTNPLKSDYEAFVEKFKPKKTTDDCYTPPAVYEAVKAWALEEYPDWQGRPVVRPFWPGGDFERFDYTEGCVVIDNPPFSIYAKIVRWYCDKGIPFLLFAPGLTAGVFGADVTYIVVNASITYENGAVVNTNFVTNHDCEYRIVTSPELRLRLDEVKKILKPTNPRPLVSYPSCITSIALMNKIGQKGIPLKIRKDECEYIRKVGRKQLYGPGFILSEEAKRRAEEAKRRAEEANRRAEEAKRRAKEAEMLVIELTDTEMRILDRLKERSGR